MVRMRRISALSNTHGVGRLNVLNAFAGAYAEYSPTVHIVGTPKRGVGSAGRVVHHGLGELRKAGLIREVTRGVTIAQEDEEKGNAVEQGMMSHL